MGNGLLEAISSRSSPVVAQNSVMRELRIPIPNMVLREVAEGLEVLGDV